MSEALKKFLSPYGPGWMSVTVIAGATMLASLISMLLRDDFSIIPQLVLLAIVIISLIPWFRSKKMFEAIEKDPKYYQISDEFEHAISMRNDSVRFGKTVIFIKNAGNVLSYTDIKQVYQYIHKTNFIENERALKYVDAQGKHRKMCNLELREKSNDELAEMLSIIISKNPNVKIGYR